MRKIASFTVNHDKIVEGIYISRIDGDITTYDMRMRKPNMGDYIDNLTIHSLEHMFATYVRNSEIGSNVIYFGPMGCQTGFYLLVRDEKPEKVLQIVKNVFISIINHNGDMFGNTREECGNYRNLNLESAKLESERYLKILNNAVVTFKYE
ncbi:MAG: S-ribosylhomocysteine lyase [Clostridia bacterium]|nr:S-ribosylhomocysteine lyase [Clostridia bacterium]MBQ7788069.1 S-ribosylhomocysteine lyase [Clostridia bacterium]